MGAFTNFLTGGFLKGYRTYIVGGLLIINAVLFPWAVDGTNLFTLLQDNWEQIAIALGLVVAAQH